MRLANWGLAAALALSSITAFAGDADFTLVNRTGFTIREIYVSPTKRNQWGRDRLGDGVLENARSRHFKFGETPNCRQDIKVVFDDNGSDATWNNVDLCSIEKITIRYNRSTKEVSADAE